MNDMTIDEIVDLKGLNCPMPMLKTKKALQGAAADTIMQIEITDSGSKNDMPALLKRSGDELLDLKEDGGVFTFIIKKK